MGDEGLNEQPLLFPLPKVELGRLFAAQEWKVISLRECPMPDAMADCDQPKLAVAYWHAHVATAPHFNRDVECLVALLLNARQQIIAHHVVSLGLLDSILIHPREVFRPAIIAAAHSLMLMHNHPSGDPTPSEADINATREISRAGHHIGIELIDHIIVGQPSKRNRKGYISLRTLGHL